MIFSMIAAFGIAVLSGMGVGGGGLFVLYLAFFTDLPQAVAQGNNLDIPWGRGVEISRWDYIFEEH